MPEAASGSRRRVFVVAVGSRKDLTPYDDRYYRDWGHEVPPLRRMERQVEVDLHHNILMRTARLRPSAEAMLAAARPVAGSRFVVLAPIDMVLHAIVHLFYSGEMGDALRELVDIDVLLRHFSQHEPGFWQDFWARAEALDLGATGFLRAALCTYRAWHTRAGRIGRGEPSARRPTQCYFG